MAVSSFRSDNPLHSRPRQSDKWLDAMSDPLSSLYTFSSCISTADLSGDGDSKLIIADLGTGTYQMKLKVYRGTALMSENTLLDLPVGVVTFHVNLSLPRIPAVAVASGSSVYVYRNLKPYFKFALPAAEPHRAELHLWNQVSDDRIDTAALWDGVQTLRGEIGAQNLSTRSQHLLMCPSHAERSKFINTHKGFPLKRRTVVTAVSTIRKNMMEEDAVSCLVLGTENCQLHILDPEAFTLLATVQLVSPPVFITVTGMFDVEYRIIVACRNGKIYTCKRGMEEARFTAGMSSPIVGLERRDKSFLVGCSDDRIYAYSNRGKCLWRVDLPSSIVCMTSMELVSHGQNLLLVALATCLVHVYVDRHVADVIVLDQPVTAMRFGRFGREDNVLVLITKGGGLYVKILRRSAKFSPADATTGAPSLTDGDRSAITHLNIPKKTKMFVEQTMRERQNSKAMHRIFQYNLCLLRLTAARQYVKSLELSLTPASTDSQHVRLTAQVLGLGPMFRVRVELENTSSARFTYDLMLCFHADEKLYKLQRSVINVAMLVPGVKYVYSTLAECQSELPISDNINVLLVNNNGSSSDFNRSKPMSSVLLQMPVTEMPLAMS